MKSVFNSQDVLETFSRIDSLTPESKQLWGKMNVSQMLAHLNVAYDMTFTDKYPKPNAFVKFILKLAVKQSVVGPKPYKKNSKTAPQFIITDERVFEKEKQKLKDYMQKTLDLGEAHFEGKESHSFGRLTTQEWNTMFYKHLDHHLNQFGV